MGLLAAIWLDSNAKIINVFFSRSEGLTFILAISSVLHVPISREWAP